MCSTLNYILSQGQEALLISRPHDDPATYSMHKIKCVHTDLMANLQNTGVPPSEHLARMVRRALVSSSLPAALAASNTMLACSAACCAGADGIKWARPKAFAYSALLHRREHILIRCSRDGR